MKSIRYLAAGFTLALCFTAQTALAQDTTSEKQKAAQQDAHKYISSLAALWVQEVKFCDWTLRNRTKQELEEIKNILFDSIKKKGVKLSDTKCPTVLRISYEEDSWMRIGGPAGVDYTLNFTLADTIEGELIRNEYKGTITAKVVQVTDEKGNVVRKSLGISDTFEEAKMVLTKILDERNPLTTDEKTLYLRTKE